MNQSYKKYLATFSTSAALLLALTNTGLVQAENQDGLNVSPQQEQSQDAVADGQEGHDNPQQEISSDEESPLNSDLEVHVNLEEESLPNHPPVAEDSSTIEAEADEGNQTAEEELEVNLIEAASEETAEAPESTETVTKLIEVPVAEDSKDNATNRISGQNRFKNSVAISEAGWESSENVFLVNAYKYTDALTGGPLASLYNAPILLTHEDHVPEPVLDEIKRLKAQKVFILGGELSINAKVEENLKKDDYEVERIGGRNRYHQAALIAKKIYEKTGERGQAFLASGETFSDALSISAVASRRQAPIYLVQSDRLNDPVKEAVDQVSSWTIIGGELTINQSVEDEIVELGGTIDQRFDGKNRYDVNRQIIEHYSEDKDHIFVVSGEHFSDALPVAQLASLHDMDLLFAKNDHLINLTEQMNFAQETMNIDKFTLVGGNITLSELTEEFIQNPEEILTAIEAQKEAERLAKEEEARKAAEEAERLQAEQAAAQAALIGLGLDQLDREKNSQNTIYIDAGHGGYDSGASYYGKQEKDLNLQISKKIESKLNALGYGVIMSRTSDTALGIYERPIHANTTDADIFISVHNNAMPGQSNVSGIETYHYKYDSGYPSRYNQQYHNDPSRVNNSIKLANTVHKELIDATGSNDRGVRGMSFAVIREAKMPAILLELGYMSNRAENDKLHQDSYQEILANAVVKGVHNYFN